MFKKYSKYLVIAITALILFTLTYISFKDDKKVEAANQDVEEITKETAKEEKEIKTIKFDIKGAVKNPGVYELNENSRVVDAINKSGGLTKDADTSYLNLSKRLTDEMVIIVYTKSEIKKMSKEDTIIKYIEKECNCPEIKNDACITNEKQSTNKKETSTEKSNSKISLNKATLEELQTLPGIGKSKAEAIIKYREENNGFKDTKEITNVSGIGTSTYEKFKDLITT